MPENGCFSRARKIDHEPRRCFCNRSTPHVSKERCRGNSDPRSALPSCGKVKTALTPHGTCSPRCETVSRKGSTPPSSLALLPFWKGYTHRHDHRIVTAECSVSNWPIEVDQDADYSGGRHEHEKPFYFLEIRIPISRLDTLSKVGLIRDFYKSGAGSRGGAKHCRKRTPRVGYDQRDRA